MSAMLRPFGKSVASSYKEVRIAQLLRRTVVKNVPGKKIGRADLERELMGDVCGGMTESPAETSPAIAALKKRNEREQRRAERRELARAAAAAAVSSIAEDAAPSESESQGLSQKAARQEAYRRRQVGCLSL